MNTYHIQYFYDGHRLGSVFKAAALNNVAPSTVSQGIKTLENELGFSLTLKKKGVLQLTKEGVSFASRCEELLKILNQIRKSDLNQTPELNGSLRLATHQSFLNAYLWSRLRAFKKKYPLVDVQITTGIGAQISELLEAGQVDLAITLDNLHPASPRAITSQILIEGEFKLVSSYKYKLKKDSPCIVTNIHKPEVASLLKKASWLVVDAQLPSWTTIQRVIESEPLLGYLPDYLLESSKSGRSVYKEPLFAKTLRYPYQIRAWYPYRSRNDQLLQSFLSEVKKIKIHYV